MAASAKRCTLEIIDQGIVNEAVHLAVGRWTVSELPLVTISVGPGGCWVEGQRLRLNDAPTERGELHRGDVLTFGQTTMRVWPDSKAPAESSRLKVSAEPPSGLGLSIELWWQNELVEQWQTRAEVVRLPSRLAALDGYDVSSRTAVKEGDTYRFSVPDGCEASERVRAGEAIVPLFRPLVISRRQLQLRVSLVKVNLPTRAQRLGVGLLAAIITGGLALGANFGTLSPSTSYEHQPNSVCMCKVPGGRLNSAPPPQPVPALIATVGRMELVSFAERADLSPIVDRVPELAGCARLQTPEDIVKPSPTLKWRVSYDGVALRAAEAVGPTPFVRCMWSAVARARFSQPSPRLTFWLQPMRSSEGGS